MDRDYKSRSSGSVLLSHLGLPSGAPEWATSTSGPGARLTVWTDNTAYFPHQRGSVRVQMDLEEGYHLYVPPNPAPYTNLAVLVEGPAGMLMERPMLPGGRPHSIDGLDEQFTVADGPVTVDVGFMLLEGTGPVTASVSVDYQVCSDRDCLEPSRLTAGFQIDERPRI